LALFGCKKIRVVLNSGFKTPSDFDSEGFFIAGHLWALNLNGITSVGKYKKYRLRLLETWSTDNSQKIKKLNVKTNFAMPKFSKAVRRG